MMLLMVSLLAAWLFGARPSKWFEGPQGVEGNLSSKSVQFYTGQGTCAALSECGDNIAHIDEIETVLKMLCRRMPSVRTTFSLCSIQYRSKLRMELRTNNN